MASINLFKIDPNKIDSCLYNLSESKLQEIKTIDKEKKGDDKNYTFKITLYLEKPFQSEEDISWNWLLNEFEEQPIYAFKSPKAVLIINDSKNTYAVTFGTSYFKIDKFCDRDFGFKFASRIEFANIKTTTLSSPNLTRNKTVNTYINYNDLDFDSGESFSKMKVNAKLDKDFNLFKPAIEIGNSIRFNIENESSDGILDVILFVEKILKIPDEDVKYKIPLFQVIRDKDLLIELNNNFKNALAETILYNQILQSLSIPELEIIGANEIFNHINNEYRLKYLNHETDNITHLTIDSVKQFCEKYGINSADEISQIRIVKYRDNDSPIDIKLKDFVEYTDDEKKCILSNGRWYLFNHDYLTYLNDSIHEIKAIYKKEYDFNSQIHDKFIDKRYELEKNDKKYMGETENQIKKRLKLKYYVERCFNILREQEGNFQNFDRVDTSTGFEKMDLYEKSTNTMFAVKKGKSSSDLCYAIDQSLTSLKKYKHGEIIRMPPISFVGLWFILELSNHLPTSPDDIVDLRALNMLMLKNRIDQWKKEVRLAGFTPIIYINYRK